MKKNMEKNWWKGKVAYQIYPKSFQDSNGDGFGDLKGITNRLDYLKDLGIDIVWLSPIFKSPFIDQGYDIADYYAVDPIFGSMEDMDELIAEAKKRDIAIILDLVVNHCSDQHEWFQKALADPEGEYADYFYFVESQDGVPSNWRSYFGGSVWEPIPNTNKYYLHSFHKAQPDLNWQNPVLREKIYDMINWWLEKGIAGFRIDAIINIKKDLSWKSLPADHEDGLVAVQASLENAQPIEPFLKELKEKTFDNYNAFTVGEVFNETEEELIFFIGEENGVFSSIFDFKQAILGQQGNGWHDFIEPTAEELKTSIFKAHKRADHVGVLSTIIENHDEARGVSHFIPKSDINDRSKKALATIQMLRKGIPFIYQGQEIGMENQYFDKIEQFDDISTLNEYHVALEDGLTEEEAINVVSKYSRDNARTPMQWSDEEYFGFSDMKPWLISKQPNRCINVTSQLEDKNSVLHYYRALTSLYKDEEYGETIRFGALLPFLVDVENVIAFERVGDKRIAIVTNFQNKEIVVKIDEIINKVLLNNYEDVVINENQLFLKPYQALILVFQ